jgi:hypothetical protein
MSAGAARLNMPLDYVFTSASPWRLVTEGRRKRRSPGRSRPPRLLVDGNPTQHVAHRVERTASPVGSKMLAFDFPVARCRGKQRRWSRRPADHLIGRKVSSTGSEEPGAA